MGRHVKQFELIVHAKCIRHATCSFCNERAGLREVGIGIVGDTVAKGSTDVMIKIEVDIEVDVMTVTDTERDTGEGVIVTGEGVIVAEQYRSPCTQKV